MRLVSGIYGGAPAVVQHPHSCCFQVSSTWDVLQFRNDATTGGEPGKITIRLAGTVQGSTVRLGATISATGEEFTAVGMGSVAGYNGVRATFQGRLDFDGLRGRIAVGENGAFPGGMPSIWDISFAKIRER